MIKLFISDIDHTLYSSELKDIPQENIAALKKLIVKGIKVCLASSRVYSGISSLAEQLDLKNNGGYIIANGGSLVVRCCDNKQLVNECMSQKQVREMYELAQRMNVGFNIAQDQYNITTGHSKIMDYDFADVGLDYIVTHDIFKYVKDPVYRVSFSVDNGSVSDLLQQLNNLCGQDFYFNIPQNNTVDVGLKHINKLTGIKAVINDMGIDLDETAAIGDNGNDVEMLKAVKISGCVANGSQQAKEVADYIVADCKEAGVAQFIEERLLND